MAKSQTALEQPKPPARSSAPNLSSAEVRRELENLTRDNIKQMRAIVDEITDGLKDSASVRRVSEFAEAHRIIPQGLSRFPGPFRFDVTPYLREIADCFSASSPVQQVAVMKGARIGFSVGVGENWILYNIAENPGPMAYVTADKLTAERNVEIRIDPMINLSGFGHLISSQVEKRNNRSTGDTKSLKQYPGGFLRSIGPNSAAALRNDGIKFLYLDEIDAYPMEVGQGGKEGDPIKLAVRRTDEYEDVRKILYGSTPTVADESRIEELYLYGDQRHYYVPCKHCGEMQPLEWRDENEEYRIRYEFDQFGILIPESVHYVCRACGGHWVNDDKAWFLPRGEWRATAVPREPGFRSYYIPSLYSPIGMRSWYSIAQEWVNIGNEDGKRKAFIQTVLGQTWVESGEAPDVNRVMLRREEYTRGTLPDATKERALFCTVGADVQGDRIECETVAWGRDKESWSVDYFVLPGDTSHADSEAWSEFYKIVTAPDYSGLPLVLALVDSGYYTQTVYDWCSQFQGGVLPVQGSKYRRPWIFKINSPKGRESELVELNTHDLKVELYGYLKLGKPADGQPFQKGYPHFPVDYDEKHFNALMAEKLVMKRSKNGKSYREWHLPHGRRNEQLDCRVYAMGALNVHARAVCEEVLDLEELDWSAFWDWWENNAR
ncbi:MAG: phage terminase large subunit family protein [Chloroflexota bacterium]